MQHLLSLQQVMVLGKMFYFFSFFTFTPVPLSFLSLSFISSTLFYLVSPSLWEMTQNDPQGLTCRLTPAQSINERWAYLGTAGPGLNRNLHLITKEELVALLFCWFVTCAACRSLFAFPLSAIGRLCSVIITFAEHFLY